MTGLETCVGVFVEAGLTVGVDVAGTNTSVLVGVLIGAFVFVAGICAGSEVGVGVSVERIRVGITALGVR